MKQLLLLFSLFFYIIAGARQKGGDGKYVLVIHGGAGTILKSQMSVAQEKAYKESLEKALQSGEAILKKGGTAVDAVEAAVKELEDNPLFNAGKGAVFTNEGKNELDASIMNGENLAAGAVAGVTVIRNPVSAARAVMEKSPHVMMTGAGAEKFAKEQGLTVVDPSYFYTESRWKGLERARTLDSTKSVLDHADTSKRVSWMEPVAEDPQLYYSSLGIGGKYGTVGAVALDKKGNLAAATSTGGMTNKKFGRIGDAPIIGAGTYADNNTVAISCTGWGEYFIRLVMAKAISDRMEYGKMTLQQAADEMVMKKLPALGGDGGLVAVDKEGNIAMPFCTEGMYRGFVKESGEKAVLIYK